ncbi:MAG: hypothetical protein ABI120_23335 [Gemmatimonadaceae bacterium]
MRDPQSWKQKVRTVVAGSTALILGPGITQRRERDVDIASS